MHRNLSVACDLPTEKEVNNDQPGGIEHRSIAEDWTCWKEALSSPLSPTSTCQECPDGSCGEQWVSLIFTSGDLVT